MRMVFGLLAFSCTCLTVLGFRGLNGSAAALVVVWFGAWALLLWTLTYFSHRAHSSRRRHQPPQSTRPVDVGSSWTRPGGANYGR